MYGISRNFAPENKNIVEIVKIREKMIETLSVFQWSILMI